VSVLGYDRVFVRNFCLLFNRIEQAAAHVLLARFLVLEEGVVLDLGIVVLDLLKDDTLDPFGLHGLVVFLEINHLLSQLLNLLLGNSE